MSGKILLIIGLASIISLAACGQKGDLYQTSDAPPPTLEKPDTKNPR